MNVLIVPLLWLAISLPILVIMQRWIHRHLQGIALLITGKLEWAVIFYALVLFPGVLLHELSHWLMATLLFVRTGSMSLLPRMQPDGSIQLGAVEYYKTDKVGPIRETLIGGAPLIFGTIAVLLMGFYVFHFEQMQQALQSGNLNAVLDAIRQLLATDDLFVWLYLFFAVGNAMMPSASDRRSWPAFGLTLLVIIALTFVLGIQEAVYSELGGPISFVLSNVSLAFTLTIVVNLFFIVLIMVVEAIASQVRGANVDYN